MSGGNTCCCALVGIGGKLPVCPVFFLPLTAAPGAGPLGTAPDALNRDAAAAVATPGAASGSPHWAKPTGAFGAGAGAVAGPPCDRPCFFAAAMAPAK